MTTPLTSMKQDQATQITSNRDSISSITGISTTGLNLPRTTQGMAAREVLVEKPQTL